MKMKVAAAAAPRQSPAPRVHPRPAKTKMTRRGRRRQPRRGGNLLELLTQLKNKDETRL